MVQEVVNPNAEIVYRDNTSDDPSRRKPDITKVRLRRAVPSACRPPTRARAPVPEDPTLQLAEPAAHARNPREANGELGLRSRCHHAAVAAAGNGALRHDGRWSVGERRGAGAVQARALLGWEPKVALREGLANMVDDFRHRLHVDDDE